MRIQNKRKRYYFHHRDLRFCNIIQKDILFKYLYKYIFNLKIIFSCYYEFYAKIVNIHIQFLFNDN